MRPLIVNFDSIFDWTAEVRGLWDALDWETIHHAVAGDILPERWKARRGELGLIGLVSSLVIDNAYRVPGWEQGPEDSDEWGNSWAQDWKARQMANPRPCEGGDNNASRQERRRLTGEEPFLRSPRLGPSGGC